MPPPLSDRAKSAVALALTFVAGFVDAVGFLALYQVFTAHLSGNSVHLGIDLATMQLPETLQSACAIFSFILGLLYSRILIEYGARASFRRIASWTFATELLAIVCAIQIWGHLHNSNGAMSRFTGAFYVLIALLTFSMGLQSGTLTRVGALTVYTTFVTGTLTRFAESASRWLFWIADEHRSGSSIPAILQQSRRQKSFRDSGFLLAIWAAYMVGGVSGALSERRWSLASLYLPAALVAAAILLDQCRPMSVEEEKQQLK